MAKIEQSDKDELIILRKELALQKQEKEELLSQLNAQEKIETYKLSDSNLHNIFMQMPAAICMLRGSQHIFHLANDRYMQLVGDRDCIGKPIREAFPELEGQGFFELLDGIYETRKPFIGNEMPVKLDKGNGEFENQYFNFVYQPSYDTNGSMDGIIIHAVEVTEQVLARKKIEESEKRFRILVEQAITPISILKGKDLILELANEPVYKIFNLGKEVLGKPYLEILPEMKDQPFVGLLLDVLQTGVTH